MTKWRLRAAPFEDKANCRRAHGLAGMAPSHGPYFGAGVWLKSCSSVMQVKFAAMLVLPLPLYFATLGKTQSGRVICTAGGVSLTNLVATIVSGATPCLDPVDERRERIEHVRAGSAGAVVHARAP